MAPTASWTPSKAHVFDVVVPTGNGPETVVDATASIVVLSEVYCVQHMGGLNFQVTVKSMASMTLIVDAGCLVIGGERCPVVPVVTFRLRRALKPARMQRTPGLRSKRQTFSPVRRRRYASLPSASRHVPMPRVFMCVCVCMCILVPTLVEARQPGRGAPNNCETRGSDRRRHDYGKVLSVNAGLMSGRRGVLTGTRFVRMEMSATTPVPNYLRVSGHRVTFDYRGLQRVCRRCGSSDHYRAQCTAAFCGRCGVHGHESDGCDRPCRRCGDSHPTDACPVRRS
ncbi:uncharacterized protein LOC142584516 [Dermacentor variabilis]|uniref:uncharacterized protein LOC142584516 n=1 Tax=Dermacentor variabilis TaxID=34621 RepID=UPI003F5C519D